MQLINILILLIGTLTFTSSVLIISTDQKHHKQVKRSIDKKQTVSPKNSEVQVFQLVNGVYLEKRRGGRSSGGSISSGTSSSSSGTKGGISSSSSSSSGSRTGTNQYTYQCGMVSGRNTCGYGPYYAPTAAAAAAGYGTARYHGLRNSTSEDNSTTESTSTGKATTTTTATTTSQKNNAVGIYLPCYGTVIFPIILALI